jgi:hypothetical protein
MSLNRRTFLRTIPAVGSVVLPCTALAVETETPVVSPQMQAAIDAHRTAFNALEAACRCTDEVALERPGTKQETVIYDRAGRDERVTLLALCGYRACSDAERRAKAEYLLNFERRNQLLEEHTRAILRSMAGVVS